MRSENDYINILNHHTERVGIQKEINKNFFKKNNNKKIIYTMG